MTNWWSLGKYYWGFEVFPTIITIEKVGIGNTISIYRATIAPLENIAEFIDEYRLNEPVDQQKGELDAGQGQHTAEELADALQENAVDGIGYSIGEGENVR